MSGIAAIIRFDGGPVEPGQIEAMTAAMAYRGVDGMAHWHGQGVALGHCMLHTTTESLTERQPLANEDESLVLVMDGWLSNWEELRAELLARGARLRDRSDVELVLRAYETWGDDCPGHIDGEYAFLIWDARRRNAFLARDHAARRPVNYHWDGKVLAIASDVTGVLAAPGIVASPNWGMIAEVVANEWHTRGETIWENVLRPLPAHSVSFGAGGPIPTEYWSPALDAQLTYKREDDYFEHYREVFADCVRRASRTHLLLGCDVSGGLDSSAVFAMAHCEARAGRLPAPAIMGYSLRFDGDVGAADEIAYARDVARHLGADMREVAPLIPPIAWFQERTRISRDLPPYPNSAMAVSLGEAAIADGCRVKLNGLGGDEWLEGSSLSYAEQLASGDWSEFLRSLGEDAREAGIGQALHWALRHGAAKHLPKPLLALRRKALRRFTQQHAARKFWLDDEFNALLRDRRAKAIANPLVIDRWVTRRDLASTLRYSFNEVARDWGSRMAAQTGFEARSPMYMRRFIEFAFGLPERMRNRAGKGKYIHRRSFAALLPESVIDRSAKSEFSYTSTIQLDGLAHRFRSGGDQISIRGIDPVGLAQLYENYTDPGIAAKPVWQLWGILSCEDALKLK